MSISVPTWKRFDTYPPLQATLQSAGQTLDISGASSIKAILKSGVAVVSGSCVIMQYAFTATTTNNNPGLTVVSAFTHLFGPAQGLAGSTITDTVGGTLIPAGATVLSFNSGASTIQMSANALGAGATQPLIANKGLVQYTWASNDLQLSGNYQVEFEITWTAGGIQTIPNATYGAVTVIDDLENA